MQTVCTRRSLLPLERVGTRLGNSLPLCVEYIVPNRAQNMLLCVGMINTLMREVRMNLCVHVNIETNLAHMILCARHANVFIVNS